MTKTNTANAAFEMPSMDFSKMNETFREFAEKGMGQNTEFYAKMKESAENASATAEETYQAMMAATTDMTSKAVENAKSNMDAGMKFFESAAGVKSLSEFMELQSTFFRNQYEEIAKQTKEVQELTAKHGEKAIAPAKSAFEKTVS